MVLRDDIRRDLLERQVEALGARKLSYKSRATKNFYFAKRFFDIKASIFFKIFSVYRGPVRRFRAGPPSLVDDYVITGEYLERGGKRVLSINPSRNIRLAAEAARNRARSDYALKYHVPSHLIPLIEVAVLDYLVRYDRRVRDGGPSIRYDHFKGLNRVFVKGAGTGRFRYYTRVKDISYSRRRRKLGIV